MAKSQASVKNVFKPSPVLHASRLQPTATEESVMQLFAESSFPPLQAKMLPCVCGAIPGTSVVGVAYRGLLRCRSTATEQAKQALVMFPSTEAAITALVVSPAPPGSAAANQSHPERSAGAPCRACTTSCWARTNTCACHSHATRRCSPRRTSIFKGVCQGKGQAAVAPPRAAFLFVLRVLVRLRSRKRGLGAWWEKNKESRTRAPSLPSSTLPSTGTGCGPRC